MFSTLKYRDYFKFNGCFRPLTEISFGMYHFEIGMILRTSLLVNGILFSTEVLHKISSKHINQLEECDKIFMRRLFEAEQGTPIESFYLETSAWPLRFILMARKLMFYWTILNKSESELVKAVYNAQRDFPSRNKDDWTSEVQGVLKECNINLAEQEVKRMTKEKFKTLVKEKIQVKVLAYLISCQNKHSKSQNLHLNTDMQEYLSCQELSTQEKQMLFKLRTKMLRIKTNFKSIYREDLSCSLCEDKNSEENENHLLVCPILVNHPNMTQEINKVSYNHVFKGLKKTKSSCEGF